MWFSDLSMIRLLAEEIIKFCFRVLKSKEDKIGQVSPMGTKDTTHAGVEADIKQNH